MENTTVKEIMTSNLYTASYDNRISEIAQIFEKHQIRHMPVLKEEKLVGIISSTDIERCKHGKTLFINPNKEKVNKSIMDMTLASMIMSEEVVTIESTESIRSAYDVFKENNFRALPVVEEGALVGIVSPMDFLDYFFK